MATVKEQFNTAFDKLSKGVLAEQIGVHYQTIQGWMLRDKMPDSDYAGRTHYAADLQYYSGGILTIKRLLGWVPPHQKKRLDELNKK